VTFTANVSVASCLVNAEYHWYEHSDGLRILRLASSYYVEAAVASHIVSCACACLPASLPPCLPASLPPCLPASLPPCLPASLRATCVVVVRLPGCHPPHDLVPRGETSAASSTTAATDRPVCHARFPSQFVQLRRRGGKEPEEHPGSSFVPRRLLQRDGCVRLQPRSSWSVAWCRLTFDARARRTRAQTFRSSSDCS
jgi:hypothetical protein